MIAGALREHRFALYLVGNTSSFVGGQAELLAAPWLALHLPGSPVSAGLTGLFRAVPILLVVPFGGAIADRVSPRRLLIVTQACAAIASAALAVLAAAGLIELWHVYVQVLVQGVIAGFDTTARQAFFPRLVPKDRLERAVTYNFTSTRVGMLSGPVLGGVALATPLGATGVFAIAAAGSMAMLAVSAVLRESPLARPAARGATLARDMLAGFRFALGSPVIRGLLLFTSVWTVLGQNNALLAIFAEDVLRVGPTALGLMVSAITAGQLAGGSLLIWWGDVARRGRLLLAAGAAYALVMLLFVTISVLPLAIVLLAGAGVLAAVGLASGHAMLQREAPDDMRGRVMSIQLMLTRGGIPLSWAVTGSLAGWLGAPMALALSAFAILTAAIAVGALSRSLWAYGADENRRVPSPKGGRLGWGRRR